MMKNDTQTLRQLKDKPDTGNLMTEKPGGISGKLKRTAAKKNGMSKLGNRQGSGGACL